MSLQCRAAVAARGFDVSLELPAGRTCAVIGANGSGKSTLLGVLAGLLRPDHGRIALNGRELGPLPPHRRRVALMAQDPVLFGHLRVLDNVAFGPRSRGAGRRESRRVALQWLAQVDAQQLAQRRVRELSGGQAQRIALARALAAEPDLLLLDEPLSAIDVTAAARMRQTLYRALADRTAIIVTHDVLDAVLLAHDVVVLCDGAVVESGPTYQVRQQPRSEFAAGFFGWNLLAGDATGPQHMTTHEGIEVTGVADPPLQPGRAGLAVFRPHAVSVHLQRPVGSPRNTFRGTVASLEPQGHLVRLRVGALCADITAASVADLRLSPGIEVFLAVKAAEVALYPR